MDTIAAGILRVVAAARQRIDFKRNVKKGKSR
jgi:hypothetical protein